MKTLAIAALAALNAGTAFAHTSLVPHQHPHAASVLPDALVLALAAVIVACGFVVLRKFGRR